MGDIFIGALRSINLESIPPCRPSVTKLMRAMHNHRVHDMLIMEIRPIWGGTFPFLAILLQFGILGVLVGVGGFGIASELLNS